VVAGANKTPALAAATVGVAMGARGSAVSSEAAGVVLLVDRLDRLAEMIAIARRSRAIAVESVTAGMGLSFVAMGFAAVGLLVPVAGAIVQEIVDAAVIVNALRALRAARGDEAPRAIPQAMASRLRDEHNELAPVLERISRVAESIDRLEVSDARTAVVELDRLVRSQLLPHERLDEHEIYPVVERAVGGDDPMAAMSRTHREIHHLARALHRDVEALERGEPLDEPRMRGIRRQLYALDAILRLHFAQEEELYATMAEGDDGRPSGATAAGAPAEVSAATRRGE